MQGKNKAIGIGGSSSKKLSGTGLVRDLKDRKSPPITNVAPVRGKVGEIVERGGGEGGGSSWAGKGKKGPLTQFLLGEMGKAEKAKVRIEILVGTTRRGTKERGSLKKGGQKKEKGVATIVCVLKREKGERGARAEHDDARQMRGRQKPGQNL